MVGHLQLSERHRPLEPIDMSFFSRLFPRKTRHEPFVESPLRDNWYQARSYYPLPFGLVTTVSEDGLTNIGPHSFTMPFGVIDDYSLLFITRYNSNSAINLQRTKKCAVSFIEYDRRLLDHVVALGYPGQEPAEKMKDSPFTLIESPSPERKSGDGIHPLIIQEAFQVYECTLDGSIEFYEHKRDASRHFVLRIDRILLKESWKKNLDDGNPRMPNMPISYGFRDGKDFWFTKHRRPFAVPVPNKGPKVEVVLYEANRIDEEVRFTREACEKLTGIPKAFLKLALKGIVKQAKAEGVTLIDVAFVQKIDEQRRRG
jgi:flavin reductase (DIM6/NTAB) family NADH-FMN oxidoreductase RutF